MVKQKKKNHNLLIGLIAAIVVIVLLVLIIGSSEIAGIQGTGRSIIPQQHIVQMYAQGYAFSLSPKQYLETSWTVPSTATSVTLTGSYTSGGYVEAAIMTAQQYAAFSGATFKTDALESSYAYFGDTESTTIDTTLQPGNTYYLVFYDPGVLTTITVNIGTEVALQYTD